MMVVSEIKLPVVLFHSEIQDFVRVVWAYFFNNPQFVDRPIDFKHANLATGMPIKKFSHALKYMENREMIILDRPTKGPPIFQGLNLPDSIMALDRQIQSDLSTLEATRQANKELLEDHN